MRKFALLLLALIIAGAVLFWFLTAPAQQVVLTDYKPNAENGQTMFYAGGCASCHISQGQQDPLKLGGGFALASPFGTFYAPNISPDKTHGIGNWTEAQFVTAVQKGVSPDGSHYYPAFPYTSYQRMKFEDVRDLFAFMKTLPPEATANKPHDVGFPFNIRRGLGLWKMLFFEGRGFTPPQGASPEVVRGAYLVEGLGHCTECHTPRNAIGGLKIGQYLGGAPAADGKGYVPNITPHADGLKEWSKGDLAMFLETGMTPDGDFTGGHMAAVIRNLAKLPKADREAIAAYLASVRPVAGKRPAKQ